MSIKTADRDMAAAELLTNGGTHLYEATGFHCQQAVEKYLKAALIAAGMPIVFNLRTIW
jgi:HEPN domain-containing protein